MLQATAKSIQISKVTKNSQRSSNIKIINSQLRQKLTIAKSQHKLKISQKNGLTGSNLNSRQRGKTAQFHQSRKQSYLNSQYNKRKNNLLQVTKANIKIYQRINSQKSNYSSRVLNKSSDSVNSISSRISQRSSRSKASISGKSSLKNSSRNMKPDIEKKLSGVTQPLMKAQNINMIKKQQVLDFNKVFSKPPKVPKTKKEPNNQNIMGLIQQCPNQNPIPRSQISNHNLSLNKTRLFHITPDRGTTLCQTTGKTSIGLPRVNEKTPQKPTTLQRIIEDLGYRFRY